MTVTITIDGHKLQVEEGMNVLEAALQNGRFFAASHCLGNPDELYEIAASLKALYGETNAVRKAVLAAAESMTQKVRDIESGKLDADEDIGITYDVLNKDGYTDALVCLGRYGSEKTLYFDAYIWDEEEYGGLFTFVENFRQIPNPRIDKENSNIKGLNGNNSEVWVWKGKDKIEKSQVKRD